MKQIIIIHGGNPFDSYERYVSYLKDKPIYFNNYRIKDWKDSLGSKLGSEFDVILPAMPCKENAKYSEWKIWFERLIPYFEQEVIFVGHSLGGIFLVKWLAENVYPKTIKAVFLVAAPYSISGEGQSNSDFVLPDSLSRFEGQAQKIYLYQSKDDLVVEPSNVETYSRKLPGALKRIFEDRKHFNSSSLPEIEDDIRKLYK